MRPIKSILVASDLSPASTDVVRNAASLAGATGAAVHLVHVQEPTFGAGGEEIRAMQARMHEARAGLEEQARALTETGASAASIHVAFERASSAILERAAEVQADLIVIGPHRMRPLGDAILGSTADRLVRTAGVPCLIVRQPVAIPLRHLLVPTDLSRAGDGAVREAFEWAGALGLPADGAPRTELRVLHIADFPSSVADAHAVRKAAEDELHESIAALAADFDAERFDLKQEVIVSEAPTQEILRAVEDGVANLLVMGTNGDSTLVRTLIGSVSSVVARKAQCSILLVPPARWRKQTGDAVEAPAAMPA